jgi:hypothetical protein
LATLNRPGLFQAAFLLNVTKHFFAALQHRRRAALPVELMPIFLIDG